MIARIGVKSSRAVPVEVTMFCVVVSNTVIFAKVGNIKRTMTETIIGARTRKTQ